MESSRNSRRRPSDATDAVAAAVRETLRTAASLFHAGDGDQRREPPDPITVGIAYSGGIDSTVLLHALAESHRAEPIRLVALHVHHGLSPNANTWRDHCNRVCDALAIEFDCEEIALSGLGSVEGEARALRYAALERLCARHRVEVLMTAHHADDQAETVLLNLLRGAGLRGIAATARHRMLGGVHLMRPLLGVPAATLRAWAESRGLAFVDDESNMDRRYTRNALRHDAMPAIRRIFPACAARMAQAAVHAAETEALLDEIGREDLRAGGEAESAGGLDIETLRNCSRPRAANAMRVWLRDHALRAPSAAALAEMLDQILTSRQGAQIELIHESRALRVYRGRLYLGSYVDPQAAQVPPSTPIFWNGEAVVDCPAWAGRLMFRAVEPCGANLGVAESLLRGVPLSLRARQGGERLRERLSGPSRTLKNLYQERSIAPWQRERLPLLYAGDRLVFAARLGMDARALTAAGGERVFEIAWDAWEPQHLSETRNAG